MDEYHKRSHEQSISGYSPDCPVSPSSESGSQPPSSLLTEQGPDPIGFLQKEYEKYIIFDKGATGLQVKKLVGPEEGDGP